MVGGVCGSFDSIEGNLLSRYLIPADIRSKLI